MIYIAFDVFTLFIILSPALSAILNLFTLPQLFSALFLACSRWNNENQVIKNLSHDHVIHLKTLKHSDKTLDKSSTVNT